MNWGMWEVYKMYAERISAAIFAICVDFMAVFKVWGRRHCLGKAFSHLNYLFGFILSDKTYFLGIGFHNISNNTLYNYEGNSGMYVPYLI